MGSTLQEWPAFPRLAAKMVYAQHLEAHAADMEPESLWHDRDGFNQALLAALALAEVSGLPILPTLIVSVFDIETRRKPLGALAPNRDVDLPAVARIADVNQVHGRLLGGAAIRRALTP